MGKNEVSNNGSAHSSSYTAAGGVDNGSAHSSSYTAAGGVDNGSSSYCCWRCRHGDVVDGVCVAHAHGLVPMVPMQQTCMVHGTRYTFANMYDTRLRTSLQYT